MVEKDFIRWLDTELITFAEVAFHHIFIASLRTDPVKDLSLMCFPIFTGKLFHYTKKNVSHDQKLDTNTKFVYKLT